jgi:colanic acid biosynthesis glycosyl transferase WcaI
MAHKQGLDVLAEAARELRYREGLRFVFCGNGPARQGLCTLARGLENVQFLPLQPPERLNELLNLADIHLLPQRADAADVVMPSKLTGMLASGRPVIATAQSGTELSAVVSGKGLVVLPGDVPSLVCAIDQLASDSGLRETLGRNARAYAISNLEKERVLGRFEQELLGLATSTAAVELGPNGVRAME